MDEKSNIANSNLYSLEAEEAVVGAMLLSREVISDVANILTEEDFATPQLKEIFSAIMDLFEEGKPVDVITVAGRLKERRTFDAVGGNEYLTNLVINIPTTANATYYAKIVKQKSILRKMTKKSELLLNMLQSGDIQQAKHIIENLAIETNFIESGNFENAKVLTISEAAENDRRHGTHLWLIQNFIPEKGLVIFSGRPKHGKTTVLYKIISDVVSGRPCFGRVTKNAKVLWLTFENSYSAVEEGLLKHDCTNLDNILTIDLLEQKEILNIEMIVTTAKKYGCNLIVLEPMTALNELSKLGQANKLSYEAIYAILIPIMQIMKRERLCFIGVRHSSKGKGTLNDITDVIDAPMGSTAFSAAADALIGFGLPPNAEKSTQRRIMAIGRDVQLDCLLEFDTEKGCYIELGEVSIEKQLSELEGKVYEYIKTNIGATQKEITRKTGLKEGSVKSALHRLVEKGLIINCGGHYSLPSQNNSKNNETFETFATHATFATFATNETVDNRLQVVADNLQPSEDEILQEFEEDKTFVVAEVAKVASEKSRNNFFTLPKTNFSLPQLELDKINRRIYIDSFKNLTTRVYKDVLKNFSCEKCQQPLEYSESIHMGVCPKCNQLYSLIPRKAADVEGGRFFVEIKKQ